MRAYLNLLEKVMNEGTKKEDRTGTGTLSLFGHQMRFDLREGFPVVTTKRLHLRSIFHELLWFIKGETNIQYLHDNGVTIWDEWANEQGDLGPIYGKQWRAWESKEGDVIDQLSDVCEAIKTNPDSRRLIVSAWNVGQLKHMALPPCHLLFQFYVANGRLSCQLYQRSADLFLGVPFNIASYSLLTHMIAATCDLDVGEFVWTGGDCHIYINHLEQVTTQLERAPLPLPRLQLKTKHERIFDYQYEDIELLGYQYHPPIKAAVAV